MNIVAEAIAEHLRSNRKVIVPAFGAFMVKESGERVFSDLLSTDDGLLFSLLQNKGLKEMEAAVMIDRFIFEVRNELDRYGYCRLGEIGTLRIEPTTKVLRLYPPVHGELPKQTPYIPKIVESQESRASLVENRESRVESVQQEQEKKTITHSASTAPTASKRSVKPRKKFDFVVAVAVIILAAALMAIGYGWYVSNLAVADDAAMDALRVVPEQLNE